VSGETLLRLALVPAAVWLASLAARRWGHAASGYLGGLPMIGGPITLFLAMDLGTEFAAHSALVTLAAVLGQAAHLLTFAHVGARHGWAFALACGWIAFFTVSFLATRLPLSPWLALALAAGGLLAAWRWLPPIRGNAMPPAIPPFELRLRLAAAFVLAAFILWSAPVFGPVVSGILLSLPITGSIMPPFTLALYGNDAVARLTRGFIVGLCGFTAFFFTVASTATQWGVTVSFLAAVAAALGAIFVASRNARPHRR
jgi:hypothetical protein